MRNTRIELFVRKLDWRLEGRVPRSRRRAIRNELRANLAAAAEEVGTEEAIRRLGDVRDLAAEYLEFESGRVNVRTGVYAAVIALAVLEVVGFAMFHGFRTGFDAAGGTGVWTYSFWPYSFEGRRGEFWAVTVAWPALVGFPLLAFLLWGRAWRLLRS